MNTEVSPETENRALRWIALIEDTALVSLLSVLILLDGGQVLLRNFLDMGLVWGGAGVTRAGSLGWADRSDNCQPQQ